MRASMAYFAGVGTVVAAVAVGLGGGLLISNIVSPHEPRIEMSKLEQRMASKPIPVSNAPSEPVSYLAATAPAASSPITVATPAPQTAPANAASTRRRRQKRRVREVRLRVRRRRHRRKPLRP